MKLVYCCDEIQQAMKRVEIHSLLKKEIENEETVLQTQKELDTVDFEEVDNLISKAQQLILTKDSKQPSKNSGARVKSAEVSAKKTAASKGPTTAKRPEKSVDHKPRKHQANVKLKPQKSKSKEMISNQSVQQVQTKSLPRKLPEPYKEEFLTLLNDCNKYKKSIKRNLTKHRSDTDKEKLAFLGAVGSIEMDQKPCYIKKNDFIDGIFEQFEYESDSLPNRFLNLKETLLDQIDFVKQNQRVEFLLTHSKLFRQYLMKNEVNAETYRLIHLQLTKSLPVLIVDDEDAES